MTNRTLVILTIAVIVAMLLLFGIQLSSLSRSPAQDPSLFKRQLVRGIAVSRQELLYTLNFDQQQEVIDLLNRSVRVIGIKPGKRQKPNIDRIIIYQFDSQPDLVIHPIAYVDDNLVFSVPQFDDQHYLMELSEGDLQRLLSVASTP